MADEMKRYVTFPFPGDRFPSDLGAVIQRTILDGQRPARYVGHTSENEWIVGDGVDDPNVEGACVVAHMRHVVDLDASIESLATLPVGFQARRASPGEPWAVEPFAFLGDDEKFASPDG